ncbi:MAG: hypothetical protein IJ647_02935 [Prevotella sp.]|nr:hypothetical protein [Prevotella sp.]
MKQRRLFIIALAAIASMNVFAQQSIIVKDSATQEPIAYTSVWFGNEAGGYTDESGRITIPEGTGRIRLSHICYETRSISLADISGRTVMLVPKSVSLSEVSVSAKAPKRMKTVTAGLTREKTQTGHRGTNGFEMALFIPYDSTWTQPPYIHAILASLDYATHWLTITTIKTPIRATLRFDLRRPDGLTGAPSDESLISGGIIVQPDQKVGKEGIRLTTPIPFPRTGVYVVMEWITTAAVSESGSLIPALNMTLDTKENRTWNKKSFSGKDWMREQAEPIYREESARTFYKGRIPNAKLGLEITTKYK